MTTRTRLTARLLTAAACVAAAAVLAGPAAASQLIDRNASGIKLAVNKKGYALLTYHARGRLRHVLAWGAINARPPSRKIQQFQFRLDYSGGWGRFRKDVWRKFPNACRPYDGPKLAWVVTACKAPDNTYWAVQAWQTPLPDLGFVPWLNRQSAWEMHLSHWSGPLAKLEVWNDWVYGGRFHELFGRLTYKDKPVFGYRSTNYGAPQDRYGRLFYLDTYNSVYGKGWRRENSFLAHRPTGIFCYGFYTFDPFTGGYEHPKGLPKGTKRGPGIGEQYRITVEGPGVTADVMWQGPGLHNYDPNNPDDVSFEDLMNEQLRSILGPDKICRHY